MQEVIIEKEVLELQGKTVRVTQGAYKGEMGVIADIEESEGSIFFIVILENGKERYFTKDFIEIVEEEDKKEEQEGEEIKGTYMIEIRYVVFANNDKEAIELQNKIRKASFTNAELEGKIKDVCEGNIINMETEEIVKEGV